MTTSRASMLTAMAAILALRPAAMVIDDSRPSLRQRQLTETYIEQSLGLPPGKGGYRKNTGRTVARDQRAARKARNQRRSRA